MDKLELVDKVPPSNREKEVYRTLRTNVEFTGVENRVIAVSSCLPGDGKSSVSFQLACAFAENEKKTLFVDADLRKSTFVQRFDIKGNPKGLSHYLSGQEVLSKLIYRTNKDCLYVMPVGSFPSNPTELFGKQRFSQLLEEAKKVFDYVIVDTPPLGSVVDAAVIAKYCDATILTVASNSCSRTVVKNMISQLRNANPNFLGVVLNKVDVSKNTYYNRKSYYKYYNYDKKHGGSYYASYYGEEK